jgi:hypothetical protein
MTLTTQPVQVRIPSDALSNMRDIVAAYPLMSALCQIYRIRVVVDANAILRDLLWLAKRKKPNARTKFQEVIAAGTVLAFAPPQLDTEVRRHFPRIAHKENVLVARLEAEWEAYRTVIQFRTPREGERPEHVQDPDDLPYLYLCAQIGAEAIYTFDSDLKAMGAPVIGADIILALCDYSRAAPLEVSIKVGGTIVCVVGAAAVSTVGKLLQGFLAALSRLPRGLQLMLAGAALVMLAHPSGRMRLRKLTTGIPARVNAVLRLLEPVVSEALATASSAQQRADAALAIVRPALGAPKPGPLRVYALRVLLQEQRPMYVDEISRLILRDGYVTRAKDFCKYVGRVLGSSPDFTRNVNGEWMASVAA